MIFRATFFSLTLGQLSLYAEPLITLQEANGTDKLKVELLDLQKDKALLRRADGQEFETPLAYLAEASRTEIRETWTTHRTEIKKLLQPLNKALGHSLFASNGNIWNEKPQAVASRLRLPLESKTPYSSSYRLYTRNGYTFAGANPKTMVAYGDHKDRTLSLSIIYANKGDTLSNVGAGEDHFKTKGASKGQNRLASAMAADAAAITKTLTQTLGEPIEQKMLGQGNKSHKAQRWDWNGHSFLLAHVKGEYVGLNIVRADFADGGGRFSRVSDGEMKVRLKENVTEHKNGDVFINNIPMVDQGPKGYCAPATFERAMRHAGVPADMYLLATLATVGGGGTNTAKLYDEVAFTTRSKGGRTARQIELKTLAPKKLKRYINKGVPILWQMRSLPEYNRTANARTRERRQVKDWPAYASKIEIQAKQNAPKLRAQKNYHICMIIGYNETTNEIAVSDSWGKNYTIRWIHLHEAEAVSNRNGFVIDL